MESGDLKSIFSLKGKVAVITGGGGILCGAIARGYLTAEAIVYLLDIDVSKTSAQAEMLKQQVPGADVVPVKCDVLDRECIGFTRDAILERSGKIDILINGAGGNHPDATTDISKNISFFDLPDKGFTKTLDLNFMGTVFCSQVFGKTMVEQGSGCIINISSMSGITPLTRIPAYSAAKAAVVNFTRWLAVDVAQNSSTDIRVNTIAPGFIHTEQNHYLLYKEVKGKLELTDRGNKIIAATPHGKFGKPEDLVGAAIWLASDSASFVTGTVVCIDGGFSSYSGV